MSAGDLKTGSNLDGGIVGQLVATTSAAALYLVPASTYAVIKGCAFANESAGAVTVSYGVAKAGNTIGAAGTFLEKGLSLAAAGSLTATVTASELVGMLLGPGDTVWHLASAGTSVTGTISAAVSH